MSMRRKDALKRLKGFVPNVEEHLQQIADNPTSRDVPHWIDEIKSWIRQMEKVLPHVGVRTANKWRAQIEEWKAKLEN
jgi:hypothetical protein